jgi:hypothetical protein
VRAAETCAARGSSRDRTPRTWRSAPHGVEQIEMRLTIAHVVHAAAHRVRNVMDGSGAGVHYLDNELQRLNRDVQMMSAHTVFDCDL